MELQSASDACHTTVIFQEEARYDLLTKQIIRSSELGLRGIAIDGSLTEADQKRLRSNGYILQNVDGQELGYRLLVLW